MILLPLMVLVLTFPRFWFRYYNSLEMESSQVPARDRNENKDGMKQRQIFGE